MGRKYYRNIILTIILVLAVIFHQQIYVGLWFICVEIVGYSSEMYAVVTEKKARDGNRLVAEKWIEKTYGEIISKVTTIEFSNRSQGWGTNSFFHMESPFATGTIYVNSKTKEVLGGFHLQGVKFQHLYSNWVKKQVGIEDENVELYFNRAICGSRVIGDNIYIDFNKITDLNNLEEQICVNTHNIYIRSNHHEQGVDIKLNNINDIKEVLNYSDLIEEKIRTKIFIDTNHFMPSENNHLFIYILSQNNEDHIITVMYDYDKNIKKYCYNDKDSKWIEYE